MAKLTADRAELYRSERAKGMTYKEIAEKYGVSHQRVAQCCGGMKECQFRAFTKERCIYVNLRNWLNENKVSLSEFIRRCGCSTNGTVSGQFSYYLRGYTYPSKQRIDKFISVTGLTYEQLWEVDDG